MKIKKLVLKLPKQYVRPGYYCFYRPHLAKCFRFYVAGDVLSYDFYQLLLKHCINRPGLEHIFFVPAKKKEELLYLFLEAGFDNVLFLETEPFMWN